MYNENCSDSQNHTVSQARFIMRHIDYFQRLNAPHYLELKRPTLRAQTDTPLEAFVLTIVTEDMECRLMLVTHLSVPITCNGGNKESHIVKVNKYMTVLIFPKTHGVRILKRTITFQHHLYVWHLIPLEKNVHVYHCKLM